MLRKLASLVIALSCSCLVARSQTQCVDWGPAFHAAGPDESLLGQIVFDDGSGPELYVCGFFTEIDGIAAPGVARWNGTRWQAVGASGLTAAYSTLPGVYDFAIFDDGTGPALYVGGDFSSIGGVIAPNIAKWNGSEWESLGGVSSNGTNRTVFALEAYDDGSGQKLYVGGNFSTAGPVSTPDHIARWNGSDWEHFTGNGGVSMIQDFLVFDDGSGPELYACGDFAAISGVPLGNVGRFDGTTWHALGSGTNLSTYDLEVYDDGSGAGPQLYAAGGFWIAGGHNALLVARWDGTDWHDLDGGLSGPNNYALSMTAYDDGSGAKLYVGGTFLYTGSSGNAVENLAAWDGTRWLTSAELPGCDRLLYTLGTYDDGSGARLIAGGLMTRAGDVAADHLAAWDGTSWSPMVQGNGVDHTVFALASHDDGSGPALYAGGDFFTAGSEIAVHIAKWTAAAGWSTVGPGAAGADGPVNGLLAWNEDGSGAAELFATGEFTEIDGVAANAIARWDGAQWSPLGGGLTDGLSTGNAMAVYDDGNGEALYVTGAFITAGGVSAQRIAKWDGASWSALDSGLNAKAHSLATFDSGGGERLYVGGEFSSAGFVLTPGIASWNGAAWSSVGGGMSGKVFALATFDDGSGPALYAGGEFTLAGGVNAGRVARWNGTTWSAVGAGFSNGLVRELATFDDGSGPALYAGGTFTQSGGMQVKRIARWNGSQWQPLGTGLADVSAAVEGMGVFDDGLGLGPALWVGGTFKTADGEASPYLARWGQTCCAPQVYCPSGPSSQGCVPSISSTGRASASAATSFTIDVANVDGERSGIVFYGLGGTLSVPWGSSFLCVKEPTQRTGLQNSGASSGSCNGAFHLDWNGYLAAHPNALGTPFSAGDDVWVQAWYRATSSVKTTHMSDALHIQMCP